MVSKYINGLEIKNYEIIFEEVRTYLKLTHYLDISIFKELKDKSIFNSVKPFLGSIQWKNGQDLCPDTLYLESEKLI